MRHVTLPPNVQEKRDSVFKKIEDLRIKKSDIAYKISEKEQAGKDTYSLEEQDGKVDEKLEKIILFQYEVPIISLSTPLKDLELYGKVFIKQEIPFYIEALSVNKDNFYETTAMEIAQEHKPNELNALYEFRQIIEQKGAPLSDRITKLNKWAFSHPILSKKYIIDIDGYDSIKKNKLAFGDYCLAKIYQKLGVFNAIKLYISGLRRQEDFINVKPEMLEANGYAAKRLKSFEAIQKQICDMSDFDNSIWECAFVL